MNRLPDNIKRIDVLRIEKNINKLCNCLEPRYSLDTANRFVYCQDCGAIVDPFEALKKLAHKFDHLNNQVANLLEQAREIRDYKPHLVVFKSLESSYRGKKMLPVCPNCSKAFYFEEICQWTNRRIEELRREKQKQKEEQVLEGQTKLEW